VRRKRDNVVDRLGVVLWTPVHFAALGDQPRMTIAALTEVAVVSGAGLVSTGSAADVALVGAVAALIATLALVVRLSRNRNLVL
jgi:hypothetical protein